MLCLLLIETYRFSVINVQTLRQKKKTEAAIKCEERLCSVSDISENFPLQEYIHSCKMSYILYHLY